MTYSIKVLMESIFSLEGCWSWNSQIFFQASYSFEARNPEKCYYSWFFVDVQNFPTLRTCVLLHKVQMVNFIFNQNIVKQFVVCSINHFGASSTESMTVQLRFLFRSFSRISQKLLGSLRVSSFFSVQRLHYSS